MRMSAIYDWANLWSTSIEVLGDACDTARGLQCPKETCKRWTGGKSLWGMVFQTHEDARDEFSAPSLVVKYDAGNTMLNTYLKIWSNDDRILLQK